MLLSDAKDQNNLTSLSLSMKLLVSNLFDEEFSLTLKFMVVHMLPSTSFHNCYLLSIRLSFERWMDLSKIELTVLRMVITSYQYMTRCAFFF